MGETLSLYERMADLERRVAQLEQEAMHHRRLGPSPESLTPDMKRVDKMVATAREAMAKTKKGTPDDSTQ
jgi:hypothetical protein